MRTVDNQLNLDDTNAYTNAKNIVPIDPNNAEGIVEAAKGAPCSSATKKEIGPAIQGNPPIQPPKLSPHFLTAKVTPAMSGGIKSILVISRNDTR